MLESICTAFAVYYIIIGVLGIFLSMTPIMGTFLGFGVLCLVGGYFARSSRQVSRLAYWIGGVCIAIFALAEFILPVFQGQKTLVIIIAVCCGIAVYIITRRFTFRRYVRRRDANGTVITPAPPRGKEWLRWVFALVL